MNKIINRIREQKNIEYILFNSIPLLIKDKLNNSIDVEELITSIENTLPSSFKNLVNSIIILDDPMFSERKINALYHDKILYISNNQDDSNDILDDIVHEYSHALEEEYNEVIYSDNSIKNEFLMKRQILERTLRHQGLDMSHMILKNLIIIKVLTTYS